MESNRRNRACSGSNCGAGGPDLAIVPVDPDIGRVGYCQRGFNQFTVTVKNQGNTEAPVSKVTVEFLPGGSLTQELFGPGPNGALPPGIAWDVQFPDSPPGACFDVDCDFRITVDSDNQVGELNEANNSVDGRCIG